jgi:hypothetical protein
MSKSDSSFETGIGRLLRVQVIRGTVSRFTIKRKVRSLPSLQQHANDGAPFPRASRQRARGYLEWVSGFRSWRRSCFEQA